MLIPLLSVVALPLIVPLRYIPLVVPCIVPEEF